jgi:lipopolysaccharide export LptBFGC system permease protein LptF
VGSLLFVYQEKMKINPLISLIIGMILCVINILLDVFLHNYSLTISLITSLVAIAFILNGIIIFKKNARK